MRFSILEKRLDLGVLTIQWSLSCCTSPIQNNQPMTLACLKKELGFQLVQQWKHKHSSQTHPPHFRYDLCKYMLYSLLNYLPQTSLPRSPSTHCYPVVSISQPVFYSSIDFWFFYCAHLVDNSTTAIIVSQWALSKIRCSNITNDLISSASTKHRH